MSNRSKNIIYSAVLLLAMLVVYKFRQADQGPKLVQFNGKTMGPIVYNVSYFDHEGRNFKPQVDSILKVFNQSLNTYIPDSEISTFNRDSSFQFDLPFFKEAVETGIAIYKETNGAYDPSIAPLINTWGFGYVDNIQVDSAVIDSLKAISGMENLNMNEESLGKKDKRLQFDFNASAKGYGDDVDISMLKTYGIDNAFVEIGGEVAVSGRNIQRDTLWTVGVLDPNSTELNLKYHSIISLENKGMATSGNYFNYQIID